MLRSLTCMLTVLVYVAQAQAAPTYKVLIVDGQNNHNWQGTTPLLKKALEDSGLFTVDVATSPAKGQDMTGFRPKFADYQAVLSNYNGAEWPAETQQDFVEYVRQGGGIVIVHAANNSFPKWREYNEIIGLGGWGGRNEQSGPYVRYREGSIVRDTQPGPGGHHGKQHPFQVIIRDDMHPITAGLPRSFLHAQDELYDKLRGPAENMKVLATSYADPATGGSGEHEPMIMTINYGEGRVFHTPMGHSPESMQCVAFITVLQRGTEWACSGKVTKTEVPSDFPTADAVSVRK